MQVYLFDKLEKFNYENVFELLSADRQKKVMNFKSDESRNLSAAAYMLLKYAVRDFAWLDAVPEMSLNGHGKPYFKDIGNLYFNLSHCKYGVVCGISDKEIGVDIQDVRKFSDGTVKKVMCPAEKAIIEKSDAPERAFAKIWSMKESYVKLSGEGISFGLQNVDTTQIKNIRTFEYERYFVSVAGNGVDLINEPKIIEL
ncbi:MAG: 4'-phosphopantetheinyl transferase superfamily protein [Clostridiales bacterium]|nr:4'-phosphopantetheinyl transferase superfamily protein [Clostridiales bacterium]